MDIGFTKTDEESARAMAAAAPRAILGKPTVAESSSDSEPELPRAMLSLAQKRRYMEKCNFPNCEDANKYEKLAKIGQGTFGEVFKAREKNEPKNVVAMKRVLMVNESEGFPITSMREIRILQQLKHVNIINLIEVCSSKANVGHGGLATLYLVFDFCEHDLAGLLANVTVKFTLGEIKKVMQQLLNGLYFTHANKILHRDLKSANVLITRHGVLKLADFGLARPFSVGFANRYTNCVVTLWYRPPELLLGERDYGPPVDMWGAGCIMAEMWTRSPIMPGRSESHQLTLIAQLCGSFTPAVWPGVVKLEVYKSLQMQVGYTRKIKQRLRAYVQNADGLDLIDKLLLLDPSARFDANAALNHDFFWTDPMPTDLGKMLSNHHQSMFDFMSAKRRFDPMAAKPEKKRSVVSGYQDRVY